MVQAMVWRWKNDKDTAWNDAGLTFAEWTDAELGHISIYVSYILVAIIDW